MTKTWNRGKVFKFWGAPLPCKPCYEWESVRPSDGALFMQVSHRDVQSLDKINLIDPKHIVNGYQRTTMSNHKKRQERIRAARAGNSPAFIILSRTEFRDGREYTVEINPYQVHRVLEFYDGEIGAVFAKVDIHTADPNKAPML